MNLSALFRCRAAAGIARPGPWLRRRPGGPAHPWRTVPAALSFMALLATGNAIAEEAEGDTAVTAIPLAEAAVALEGSAPAEVRALTRAPIAARLATEIERMPVEVGDRVEAGATLARLDCTDFTDGLAQAQATLEELQARLELADIRLERNRRLREQDAIAADRLDEARAERSALDANMRAQQSRVRQARRDVERCNVAAPFAGLVVSRPGERGAFVQPGSPLVELAATDRIELRAWLSADDAAALERADSAVFHANGQRHPVTARTVVATADSASRTREARFDFDGTPPIPGTAGRVRWRAEARAIPADLLVRRDGRLGVFTLQDGRARFHALSDAIEGRPAPTGLSAKTRLIVEGRYGLDDGDAVRVAE